MRYTVIYEPSASGYGAYWPHLAGLGVVAKMLKETKKLIRTGISAHIALMREHGETVPEPTSYEEEFDVRTSA